MSCECIQRVCDGWIQKHTDTDCTDAFFVFFFFKIMEREMFVYEKEILHSDCLEFRFLQSLSYMLACLHQ